MEIFADFIIALLDLAEAEAKAFREGMVRLGLGVALALLAGFAAAAGFGLLVWALYLAIAGAWGQPAAAGIVGSISLIVAGGAAWLAKRTVR